MDSGVYLRTSRISVLPYLFIWGTPSLTASSAKVTGSCPPFQTGRSLLAWDSQAEIWIDACCAASFWAKTSGHCLADVSIQLLSLETSPTAKTFPLGKIFNFIFLPFLLLFFIYFSLSLFFFVPDCGNVVFFRAVGSLKGQEICLPHAYLTNRWKTRNQKF